MTPERFEELANTWGANLRRWPIAERIDAQALLKFSATPKVSLVCTTLLDDLLEAHVIAPPDMTLIQAVLANAPVRNFMHGWCQRIAWWPPRAWGAGVGLIGTAAVGALVFSMILSSITLASQSTLQEKYWVTTIYDASNMTNWSDE